MPSVSKRRVKPRLAGFRIQGFKNFPHTNGTMGARGRLAAREDPDDLFRVLIAVELFVFFFEPPGISSRISRTPFMRGWRLQVRRVRSGILFGFRACHIWCACL